ncbi:MAG: phytochelatin synthase family protein [Pseudomonadota bacterium]
MIKKFLLAFFLVINFSTAVFADEENSQVEIWNSSKGLQRLDRSRFKKDFYQLVNFFEPQSNPLYCSVATGTILLNALNYGNIPSQKEGEIQKPEIAGSNIIEFHLYSQNGFLNNKTDKIKKREVIRYEAPTIIHDKEVYDAGISMTDFSKMLTKAYNLKVDVTYVKKGDAKSIDNFRQILKNYLAENGHFVVANFDGKILNMNTRGHVSPIVAYDEESDSVLVMDVALHKNQWYWAPLEKLHAAMNTMDNDTYRGYLLVGK